MSLNLSSLKPAKGAVQSRKRVGRGGKRGTYSGRGIKGQKSRSGGRSGLKAMGFKQTLQRIPKKRGFKSLKSKMEVVNLSDLENKFDVDTKVTPSKLMKAGLISTPKNGIKILGNGTLTKKMIIEASVFSESAKSAIIKAGGEAISLNEKRAKELEEKDQKNQEK